MVPTALELNKQNLGGAVSGLSAIDAASSEQQTQMQGK